MIYKFLYGLIVMNVKYVLEMVIIGGVKVVGFEKEIGSLEVGKKVDFVILNLNQFYIFLFYGVDFIFRVVYLVM